MRRLNKTNRLFTRFNWVLVAILILSSCNSVVEKKSDNKTPVREIQKVETVKSDYTIPGFLKPVSTYKNGYTPEEIKEFRSNLTANSGTTADDVGSYMASSFSAHMPSAIVHRNGDVSKLDYEPIREVSQVSATTILGTMTLEEMINDPRSRMKAIAIIHDGKIVFEEYMGIREWDNHLWASATKIFIGILMHKAEEDGLVNLSDPITQYIPELIGTEWEGVKVEDVLHQRSGLDVSEGRLGSSPTHPVTMLYRIAQGDKSLPKGSTLIDAIKTAEKIYEPGTRFEYASINTHLGTLILEEVHNKPMEDIITTEVWSKAGMEGDGTLAISASGEPMAFGAYAARLRDLARFGMLFTPSWETISHEKIVSDDYFEKAMNAAKSEIYGEDYMSKRLVKDFGEDGFGASYQWDAVFEDGDMYKSGRTGQCLYVSPETNTVVVYYSSAYQAEVWVHAYAREIVKQLFR